MSFNIIGILCDSACKTFCTAAFNNTSLTGESRLLCTVGLGAGLPCRRLSAGCRFQTEIPAVRQATCLNCATSEQHYRRSILRGCQSACMERAAFQSTWHWAIADYLQCTFEDVLILHCVWGHGAFVIFMIICTAYKCTYLLTYLLTGGVHVSKRACVLRADNFSTMLYTHV